MLTSLGEKQLVDVLGKAGGDVEHFLFVVKCRLLVDFADGERCRRLRGGSLDHGHADTVVNTHSTLVLGHT